LGGRDIQPHMIEGIFRELQKIAEIGIQVESVKFIGLRE
jgi:hypothetical protein